MKTIDQYIKMNRSSYLIMLILSLLCISVRAQQLSRHVILISIDGFRPELYLEPGRPVPNLHRLMRSGVYAREVKSVFPSLTYPSHTAMITGALPARSGIYHNAPFEPEGVSGKWFWYAKSIKTPTLWQALHSAGLRTAALQWPCTVGAEIDYNVPEIWDTKHSEDHISESRKYATAGLIEELEQNATGQLNAENMKEGSLGLDENSARMAAWIFKKYQPALMALHLPGLDVAQHEQGREGDLVTAALAATDFAVGLVLEAVETSGLKDSTTIIVTGDHGFMDIYHWLQPNKWLADAGLQGKGKDWKVRFHPAGGAAFMHLQDPKDPKLLARVRQMLGALPTGQRKLFRIIEKNELDVMGADSSAVLALSAVQGVAFAGSIDQMHSFPNVRGHHGYEPNLPEMMTGFIAAGAGIQKGMVLPRLGLEDIPPLIAALLGIAFSSPDGVLYPGILKANP